jgi:hypothetical protein
VLTPLDLFKLDDCVGMKITALHTDVGDEIAVGELETLAHRENRDCVHIMPYGSIVTMDFRTDRVRIFHDEVKRIVRISRG